MVKQHALIHIIRK